MIINNLYHNKKPKRLGRGIGSGLGKTCGKGHKGQKARAGKKIRINFEGGQTPIYRKLPKFGFKSINKNIIKIISLSKIYNLILITNIYIIDLIFLNINKLISKNTKKVKIIYDNKNIIIKHPIIFKGLLCTKKVKKIIINNGGKIN